jgi:hypothetical protein
MDFSSFGLDAIFRVIEERLPLGRAFTTLISASVGLALTVFSLGYVEKAVVKPPIDWASSLIGGSRTFATGGILPTLIEMLLAAALLAGFIALYWYLFRQLRSVRWKTDHSMRELELLHAFSGPEDFFKLQKTVYELEDKIRALESRSR